MPHIDTSVTYNVNLNTEELRIVGLALLGRLRQRDDVLAARRLNLRLQQSKARSAIIMQRDAERHAEGATVALSEAAKEYPNGRRTARARRRGKG